MKKTLFILVLAAAGGVYAEEAGMGAAELTAKLQYLRAATNASATPYDFTLSFEIDRLQNTNFWMNLAADYKVKTQEGKYIGLAKTGTGGSEDPGASANVALSNQKDGDKATNTITANNDEAYVHGWISRDANGNSNATSGNFSGTKVTVSSNSEAAGSSFTLETGNVTNDILNTGTLSVNDLAFTGTNLITAKKLTLNDTTFDEAQIFSRTYLPETINAAGNTWGESIVFNFAIASSDTINDGEIITSYFVGDGTADAHRANAFVLTLSGEDIKLSAGEGKLNAEKTTFTKAEAARFKTLDVILERDKEYTVLVQAANLSQTVYLFDGKNYLGTMDSYNGNMNGGVPAGSPLNTYTNAKFAIIPEPATATLSLLALAGLCGRRRRH